MSNHFRNPNIKIACSCERETLLRFVDEVQLGGRYVARDHEWTFGDAGWTCGRVGHSQGEYTEIPVLEDFR